ncbi:MAG: hypothetical protein PQJ60_14890 [Spirochaetales bacterium]|nr:hypothetical protein [Spirochaetales bacterium]
MKKIGLLFLIAALLWGCSMGDSNDDSGTEATTLSVTGEVTSYLTGETLSGVSVFVGDSSTTTDSDGNYQLSFSSSSEGDVIQISTEDYSPYSKSLDESNADTINLDISLIPVDTESLIDPSQSQTFTMSTQDGASLDIPDLSGLGITENLIFQMTHFDVSTDEITAAPGDFTGVDSSGDTVTIVSQGMVNVDVTGETSGDSYSFEGEGLTFTITLPCTGDLDSAPDTIEMWYYDEETGLWMEEGSATKSLNSDTGEYEYTGTVSHFSTWNMDYKLDTLTSVTGTVDTSLYPSYNVEIKADGLYRAGTFSDDTLTIINLPPSTEFELSVEVDGYTGSQVTYFSTPDDDTDGALDLGVLYSQDSYLMVSDLTINRDGTDFTITWTDPDANGYSGLIITCESEDGTLDSSTTVSAGVEEFSLTDVPEGGITFTFQATYSDGGTSDLVTKVRTSSDYATLTITKDGYDNSSNSELNGDEFEVYYYYEDLADYTLYEQAIVFPFGVTVYIEVREEDIDSAGYVDFNYIVGSTYLWEDADGIVSLTMDEDKDLTVYCYIC